MFDPGKFCYAIVMLKTLLLAVSLYAQSQDVPQIAMAQEETWSAVPVEQIADPFSKDLAWIGAGAAADLFSTSAALHWCKTCREGNPLGWDAEARISLKLGMSTGAGVGCWWLRRSGHGKSATILRWTVFGVQALAAVSNTRNAIRGH